jgi:DNA polymerase III subunit delta
VYVQELIAQAETGSPPPVIVITGGERFFIDRALAALRKAVLSGGVSGFNEDVFEGKGCSAARIVDAARTLPMLATHRLVLVRDADALAAAELDRFCDYLDQPSPSSCVVLLADKLDGRTRFAKRASKLGLLVDAAPLKPGDMRGFLQSEVRRRGARIAPDAASALLDALGNDLPGIDDALERLTLYVGPGASIELGDVSACVTRVRVESIWSLVDAVGLRDRRGALRAAASLLADREPPLRILAMIARQLRMVARMQTALASGAQPPEAARQAGAPPFKARELASAARRFEPRLLARAFAVLAETDVALKGSKRTGDAVLAGALLELTR